MRIVLADDSRTARTVIRRCLEIIGLDKAEIVEAVNGKEALSHIKEASTDLLLTDLNMPVMDGETLLKWLRSNSRFAKLPVVVITSAGNPAKEKELFELGATDVLSKPISPAILLEKLTPIFLQMKPEVSDV